MDNGNVLLEVSDGRGKVQKTLGDMKGGMRL